MKAGLNAKEMNTVEELLLIKANNEQVKYFAKQIVMRRSLDKIK